MKSAFRRLLRTPGFTAVAILTLALGIGMNTAMFSMLNTVLLRPLSYPQSERLFRLDRFEPQQPFGNHTATTYATLVEAAGEVADLAAFRYWGYVLSEPGQPADAPFAARVTANYFDVLGVKPQLGRSFRPEEDTPGNQHVLVISHRYWQTRFASAPDVIGRRVLIDGQPTEIVGVLPAGDDAQRTTGPLEIYRPMALNTEERANRTDAPLSIVGRYRDGVSATQAATQFDAIAQRLATDFPAENGTLVLRVRSLQSSTLTGEFRTITFLLVGLSGFVLLIACGNLANLLLARAISRAREGSIRSALGASPLQLIKPVAAECVWLAAVGGLAAMLVSMWTGSWLTQRFSNPGNTLEFAVDGRVLAFTTGVSLLTAVLFGLAPAWWTARARINDALKSGSRSTSGNAAQNRYRQLLIVGQFALALVLLAGAGFFIRGVGQLTRIEAGWNPSALITGAVNLASARYATAEPILAFHTELRERLLAVGGVANVAVSYEEPMYDWPARRRYLIEGQTPPAPGQEPLAFTNGVSASYFDTYGTRLLRGRLFDHTDTLTSRPVTIINDTMAGALFTGGDAVGQRLAVVGNSAPVWAEIVGVVEDVRAQNLRPSPIVFQVYKPFAQEAWQYVSIAVRATDPARVPALLDPIRRAVAALDADQPVMNLMPSPMRIVRNAGFISTIDELLRLFAGLGLLLAALGIYGVTTRLVAQRTNEIGVRIALGAQMRDIMKLVLGGGLRMTALGAVIGLTGAYFLSRFLAAEMPALATGVVLPALVSCTLLVFVTLIACLLPARRATKVDPLAALRAE